MYSVILCGGSGSRLWPLSRKNYPKQFLNLYNSKSLIQETFLRMKEIMNVDNIFFVTNKDNFFNVFNQIKEIHPKFNQEQIIVEPASRNTTPAIALAIKYLAEIKKVNPNAPIIFLPSDHYIKNQKTFLDTVQTSMSQTGNHVGTIGITPTKAHTGYGYIRKGEKINRFNQVIEFVEKPNLETAQEYLNSGQYVWNSGMYIFSIKTFAQELRMHSPEIYKLLAMPFEKFLEEFHTSPDIAIDYAISERSTNVIVFEGDFGWNDIGSFDSLSEILDEHTNTKHINIDSENIFIHSQGKKLVATSGVKDLIIVENNDSILIQKKGESQNVKSIVDVLKKNNLDELENNIIVHRPWGKYEVLIDSDDHKVKKITVYPGSKLSLQSHLHRVEHWVVIKGVAKVYNKDKEIILNENESTFIASQSKHRLENPGKIDLEIIEVQTGKYLEEDDIERYEDIYNRIEK